MSRWFRHYAGMMRDDKLVRAAMLSKQSVERVVWIWGAILESAAEINDGGRYDLDPAEVAYFLRADEADICGLLAALEAGGRLAEGRVVKWSDRQFQSDNSAERQKRHRDRKKGHDDGGSGRNAQSLGRDSDAPVTSLSRHGDAPDTETDISVPNGTGEPSSPPTLDPKTILFRDGLATLATLAGRPPAALRSTLGRWMKLTGDDAGALLAEIEKCRGSPPADPISWIEARLKPRKPNEQNRRVSNAEQSAAAMARVLGRLNGGGERDSDVAGENHDHAEPGFGDRAARQLSAIGSDYGPR